MEGAASETIAVISGVPQGTVLGLLQFWLFINDLPDCVQSSSRLFADDCILYRESRTNMTVPYCKMTSISKEHVKRSGEWHSTRISAVRSGSQDQERQLLWTIPWKATSCRTKIIQDIECGALVKSLLEPPQRSDSQKGKKHAGIPETIPESQQWKYKDISILILCKTTACILTHSMGPLHPGAHTEDQDDTTQSCPLCDQQISQHK